MLVNLKHSFVSACKDKQSLLEGVYTLKDFMKSIEKEAITASFYTDPEKYKGNAFECFIEYLLKSRPTEWIGEYEPNTAENDFGIDGFGIGLNGKPATVQIKYRKDVTSELDSSDHIPGFITNSLTRTDEHQVDQNDTKNMLVFTTAKGIHYITQNEIATKKVVCINYKEIAARVDKNILFWDGFRQAFYATPTCEVIENSVPLYEHQQEALNATLNNTKGIIHLPTGTGKTTIVARSIIEKIKENKTIEPIVIASPRILLTKQILKDIQKELLKSKIEAMYSVVNSGNTKEDDEIRMLINTLGFTPYELKTTTIPAEIRKVYKRSRLNNIPLISCAVYDSVKRIKESKIPVSNIYCDEAHHLLENDFNYITNSDTFSEASKYYFTATLKETESDIGLGMNNKSKYGEILCQKSPAEMVKKGIIVRPRLHVISTVNTFITTIGEGVNKQESIDPYAIVTGLNEHKAELNKYSDIGAKLLVICKGTTHLEGILNAKYFIDYCKKHKSLKVFSISSNGGACIGVGDQKKEVSREDWLNQLKSLKDTDDAVIFHIDILTEGIDVPGITCIFPLTTMTKSKMYQNFGRASRLTPEDRKKLLAGELSTDFLNNPEAPLGYRKPYAYIMVPNYTEANIEVAEQWKAWLSLFREYGSSPKEDIIISGKTKTNMPVPLNLLNQDDKDVKGISTKITKLYHEIEEEEKANYFFLNVSNCNTIEDINDVYEKIGIKDIQAKYLRFNADWFIGHKYLTPFLPKEKDSKTKKLVVRKIVPKDLAEQMRDKANCNWKDPNLKILIPYCGAGELLIQVYNRLIEAGHSKKHIIENMLYGVDPNPDSIKFIEEFWKFNKYKHNLKTSSILNKDWDFKDMQFDLIIMNPPYDIGGKVVKAAIAQIKDTGEIVNLMPLNQYKRGLFEHIQDFELVDAKVFEDAIITPNLNISVLKKAKIKRYTWDQLLLKVFDQKYIEFYKWNMANNKGLAMCRNDYKEPSYFNIDTDFIETSFCYFSGAGFSPNGRGYKFNVDKADYGTDKFGHTGHIKFDSKRAKDNFCKYWYNGKRGESLASKTILGIHAGEASVSWYMGIPQIDWELIDTNPLWIAGQYDEAVLDTMNLAWDTDKENIIAK